MITSCLIHRSLFVNQEPIPATHPMRGFPLDFGLWTAPNLDIKAVSLFIIHSFAKEPFDHFSKKGIYADEEKNLSAGGPRPGEFLG